MKKNHMDAAAAPSPKANEVGWLQRKHDLLQSLAESGRGSEVDGENLDGQMQQLAEKVESLEKERHLLAKQVKDLQDSLGEKKLAAHETAEKSDETKKNLVRSLASRRGLLNEIDFFEKEKSRLLNFYGVASEQLQNNVADLDRTLQDIRFFKGEAQALMDKLGMLEGEVPVKYRDMDNLDERIKRASEALQNFYGRMQRAEKSMKETYYKSKTD